MITTDRAELEAMLNELKAVASVAEQESIQCEDSEEGESHAGNSTLST